MKKLAVAFASGKGGTGKTSLAVNFAKYLSQHEDAALIDLDVEEPNTGIFFPAVNRSVETKISEIDLPEIDISKCTHCGECVVKCNFNAIAAVGSDFLVFSELCKGCGRCRNVCAPGAITMKRSRIGVVNEYSDDRLIVVEGVLDTGNIHTKSLISDVKKHDKKKINIYDCPPGTTCPMVESISHADFVVLVTEPTPFGLHDLSLAVEVVVKLSKKFGVIINKSGDNDGIIEEYCSENGYSIIEKVPYDRTIAEITGRGEFYYDDPVFTSKMRKIHEYITGAVL